MAQTITGHRRIYNAQGTGSYSTNRTYGPYNGTNGERLLRELSIDSDRIKVQYDYDDFYRTSKTVLLNTGYALDTAYSWRQGTDSNHTSYMPSGQTETLKDASNNTVATTSISYTYDSLGNIETVSEGGVQRQKYWYDSLNQLIREDNLDLNKTIVYSYDLGGNLTATEEYAYQTGDTVTGTPTTTNSYTYGDSNWKDKLTAYNGNSITYDQIGNPLSYHNGFSFTWQKGRQLASATSGTTTVNYIYNSDGYRTAKTVGETEILYTLEGDQVLFELNGDVELRYFYDAAGAPIAFSMGSDPILYLYRKNLQGDITGVYSGSTGALLVSYVYDAWGKVTATDVAQTTESAEVLNYNPYLYRGYRYDSETELYYLNSRYYDPETGRFINADGTVSTEQGILCANMFAYCENNPITRIDSNGRFWNIFAGVVIGAVVGVVTQVVENVISGQDIGHGLVVAGVSGAVTGFFASTGVPAGGQAFVSGVVSAGADLIQQVVDIDVKSISDLKKIDLKQTLVAGAAGAVSGLIGGKGFMANEGLNSAKSSLQKTMKMIGKGAMNAAQASFELDIKSHVVRTLCKSALVSTTTKYVTGAAAASLARLVYNNNKKRRMLNEQLW